MLPHESLPTKLSLYIKNESLKINYLNLKDTLGFLYKREIWVNKNITFYQARFTIAHETGHYFYWHQNRSYLFWKLFKNYDEKQADDFAMKSLLPKNKLLEEWEKYQWDLTILEKVFWIEMQVIEKRIKQIFQN